MDRMGWIGLVELVEVMGVGGEKETKLPRRFWKVGL